MGFLISKKENWMDLFISWCCLICSGTGWLESSILRSIFLFLCCNCNYNLEWQATTIDPADMNSLEVALKENKVTIYQPFF